MSTATADSIRDALGVLRGAIDDLDRASSALDDAHHALKQLDPSGSTVQAIPDANALDHLFRVIRSIVNQDGVFDFYDLALASEDAQTLIDEEQDCLDAMKGL